VNTKSKEELSKIAYKVAFFVEEGLS